MPGNRPSRMKLLVLDHTPSPRHGQSYIALYRRIV